MAYRIGEPMIAFGTEAGQQLEPGVASRLLTALHESAPATFGYYLALAVTGVPPTAPRMRRSATETGAETGAQDAD